MEQSIFPIEIIAEICMRDFGNWAQLIRVCKAILTKLMPLRWQVKSVLRNSNIFHSFMLANTRFLDVRKGDKNKCIVFSVHPDYWQIDFIKYTIGDHSEEICIIKGLINDVNWKHSDKLIGVYWRYVGGYYIIDMENKQRVSKDDMIMTLNKHHFKYTWLKYLPNVESE